MAGRRIKGEGSIYQRASDDRWIGVVDLGIVGGRRIRKTVSAPTLRELRPKYARLKAQLEAGVHDENMTVEAWMNRWLDHIAAQRNRPSTLRTYRMYVDRWIVPHLGKIKLSRLRPDHVDLLMATMVADGRSDATRRQVHSILRRALKIAVNYGLIADNPAAKIDAPAVGQGSHGKFTTLEARTILRALTEPYDRARWAAALVEGLRQGEALGLRWEDIDFREGLIRIERAAQRVKGKGIVLVEPKSKASRRYVPMLDLMEHAFELMPGSREGFVFGGETPLDPRRDWQNWKDMLADVGLPHRPLHAARATTASLLSEANVPPKIIAEIMGHSQVAVTEGRYIHGDSVVHKNAMGAMADLLALD